MDFASFKSTAMSALQNHSFNDTAGRVGALFRILLPKSFKYTVILLFLLNIRGWPLFWHIRVFYPALISYIQHRFYKWTVFYKSKKAQRISHDRWVDKNTCVGGHPFETAITYKSWCSPDAADIRGHMSNSSYAQALDAARLRSSLIYTPSLFRAGGWIALAATHFHFIREIPIFAKFEVREHVGSWDDKWMFIVSRFVIKPSSKASKKVKTPADPLTSASTTDIETPEIKYKPESDAAATLKSITTRFINQPESDGSICTAIGVSLICFKIGRITVPPNIVIGTSGFAAPPSPTSSSPPYSHTNPPPHWEKARKLMYESEGGGVRQLRAFMKGGWKDVPKEERWWEQALAPLEERRVANMEIMMELKNGMESTRGVRPDPL